jgi:hypothetical protein
MIDHQTTRTRPYALTPDIKGRRTASQDHERKLNSEMKMNKVDKVAVKFGPWRLIVLLVRSRIECGWKMFGYVRRSVCLGP